VRLTELEPRLLKITEDPAVWRYEGVSFADADGLEFLCPKCWLENKGPIGTHAVICWKPHVPQTIAPIPGRWAHQGTGLEDVTLVAGSSSIQLIGGCNWHGYVRNGNVVDA
jgi:hypothetical protein